MFLSRTSMRLNFNRFLVSTRKFSSASSTFHKYPFMKTLGLEETSNGVYNGSWTGNGPIIECTTPNTNETIGFVRGGTVEDYESCINQMNSVKAEWGELPLPVRGELVRKIGERLRKYKKELGALVALEMGKILPEGEGEVQEAIDICDYAVGLSRSLNGQIIPSERPEHFMMERWNPLNGHVGIVTAFNFPCAVFFWNSALSLVCGNTQIWKGASSTSMVTVACQKIVADVFEEEGVPMGVAAMCQGAGSTVGEALIRDKSIDLISFTGSTQVGRRVSEIVSSRFASTILELGGNNAMVVMDDADLELVLRGALFASVGTAGQRCTTLRRLYLHENIYDDFIEQFKAAYATVPINDSLADGTLCGPVHTKAAVQEYVEGIETAVSQGGEVIYGNEVMDINGGNFVKPTLIAMPHDAPCIQDELFVPVLYVMKIKDLDEGIRLNNNVPQGLSSSLFTKDQQAIFKWTGPNGSDCGIVNVNIGPSGAEIGGAFGGEKETGGGRESGSDSWKQYMRRSTCTVNYGDDLPLAQGIDFGN